MEPLTKRQQEILKYLAEFIEKRGHGPTLNEIRRNFNLGSLATVHSHVLPHEFRPQNKGILTNRWAEQRLESPP